MRLVGVARRRYNAALLRSDTWTCSLKRCFDSFLKVLVFSLCWDCCKVSHPVQLGSGCCEEPFWKRFSVKDASAVPFISFVAQSASLPIGDLFCALDGGLEGAAQPLDAGPVLSPGAVWSAPWTSKARESGSISTLLLCKDGMD